MVGNICAKINIHQFDDFSVWKKSFVLPTFLLISYLFNEKYFDFQGYEKYPQTSLM